MNTFSSIASPSQAGTATAVKWTIDPAHSAIEFKVRHLMITTVTGSFQKYDATIEAAGEDLSRAKVSFWADTASVTTGSEQRDAHLRSAAFFDVANHPRISFESTRTEAVDGDGSWTLYGDLTINGITNPIKLDVEWGGVMKDPWGNVKAGVKINGTLDRSKWKLVWNAALEGGGMLLSDEVHISCEVQLTKQG